MSEIRVVSVANLNMYVKSKLESDVLLRDIYIKGEISNFKGNYSSGHLYFSLKDENACVQAVMFSRNAATLSFRPADGMKVIVRARVSLYEKTGNYQLYCDEIHPSGVGELYLAYEQLKNKLEAEGLFAPERKKPIPRYPLRIGVVTSGSGAARRDIENIIMRRFPLASIIIAPVAVQGVEAPAQIVNAIKQFNCKKAADVLIVGRGGGSIEDLWAFNDEGVARAIASSEIPVISAVGHETDFTIADFASDLRAPTPSAAAELCVPDRAVVAEKLQMMLLRAKRAVDTKITRYVEQLKILQKKPCLTSMMFYVDARRASLAMLQKSLDDSMVDITKSVSTRLAMSTAMLEAHNPLKILENGYCVAWDEKKQIIRSVKDIKGNQKLTLRFCNGQAQCIVEKIEEHFDEI